MRLKNYEDFKSWNEVKVGDIICYYDKGKIHNQKVTSVEPKEDVYTYGYGGYVTESRYKYILIKAGKGSEIKIYESYYDCSFYEDRYFTRFTCVEAAIECLKQHCKQLQRKSDVAKAKYEKFLNITNKYNKVINDYEILLNGLK